VPGHEPGPHHRFLRPRADPLGEDLPTPALSSRQRAFLLVLFAPFLAELVSGSTPPQAWILPPVVLVFMAIYGVAALVIREFSLRIQGGPATVLILGLAFGVVNEGMAAHSLFNPSWPDVGVLGSYGRWGGVNWLWAEWVVPFHAVWSISFPVFLVGQFWPEARSTRWLSDRWLAALSPVPVVVAAGSGFYVGEYPLTALAWAAMFAVVAILVLAAWRIGPKLSRWRVWPSATPSTGLGVAVAAAFFLGGQVGTWQTPRLGPYPEVGFGVLLALFVALAAAATTFDPSTVKGRKAAFAGVLTGIGFYTALSPLSEFVLGRVALVPIDVAVWIALYLLYRRRTSELPERTDLPPPPPPGAVC